MRHAEIHTNLINPYILSEHLCPINLSEKKKSWNTTRQLTVLERAPQVGTQLFGVSLPIFNFKF